MAISRHVQLVHTTGPKTLCIPKMGSSNKGNSKGKGHNESKDDADGKDKNDASRKKYESLMLEAHPVEFPSKTNKPKSSSAMQPPRAHPDLVFFQGIQPPPPDIKSYIEALSR